MWEGVRAPGMGANPAGAVPGGIWEGVQVLGEHQPMCVERGVPARVCVCVC